MNEIKKKKMMLAFSGEPPREAYRLSTFNVVVVTALYNEVVLLFSPTTR
jgi:hypothetical protein